MNVEVVFDVKPDQWGLRGDPYLWEDIKNECTLSFEEVSKEDFKLYLVEMFEKKTGRSVNTQEPIYLEKYSFGGMSSGNVDPNTWRKKLIPLLIESFVKHKKIGK